MKKFLVCFFALFISIGLTCTIVNPADADVSVTIRVVDQNSVEIPNSRIRIDGAQYINSGDSISLAEGTHSARVDVGVPGPPATNLYRTEEITVSSSTTELDIEWITAVVAMYLEDQNGELIAGSEFMIMGAGGVFSLDAGSPVTLPITDNNVYPTIGGNMADGYNVRIYPGIFGTRADLTRREDSGITEVTAGQTEMRFEWITADVAMYLNDQNGESIAGSEFLIMGSLGAFPVDAGSAVTLPITDDSVYPTLGYKYADGYDVRIYTGIFGITSHLIRLEDSGITEVSAGQTEMTFEWITADVILDVVDQYGVRIPNSRISPYENFTLTVDAGTVVPLPITDNNVYPTIGHKNADGYDLYIFPGALGIEVGLLRLELSGTTEVTAGQTEMKLEWITADVMINVVDQNGVSIPDSKIAPSEKFTLMVDTGTIVSLPITDNNVYPTIGSRNADGYDLYMFPGALGRRADLLRLIRECDELSGSTEVAAGQTEMNLEWPVVSCPLAVVDSSGINELPGATLTFPTYNQTFNSGDVITLPITDNDYFPSIGWPDADGFTVTLDTDTGSGSFEFEVNANETFDPNFVTIGGEQYGLRCIFNNPPGAEAGDNFFLYSAEQTGATINGTASDPDGDLLTFIWYEGEEIVQAEESVGVQGEAPLYLGNLQTLSLGDHTFTMEVSDGQVEVSDTVVVSVSNSPSEAACSGGGTYQAGIDNVELNASVSDFDGDVVTYSWNNDAQVLDSGQQETVYGGAPVSLPTVLLTTGGEENDDLGLGENYISLIVDDGNNDPVLCAVSVNVIDTVEPTLAPSASPAILWPPNHSMVNITITAKAFDNGGGPITLTADVSSTEDPDKDGDGNTIPDYTVPVIDNDNGIITLQLRSERSGKGAGRIYTILITATDSSGNTSIASVDIVAPHSKKK